MKNIFFIVLFILMSGCSLVKKPISEIPEKLYADYNIESLTEKDISYKISEKDPIQVIVKKEKQYIRFTDDWYIVHKDWIKTFNENQDYILNIINSKKNLKEKNNLYNIIPIVLILIAIIILFLIYKKK